MAIKRYSLQENMSASLVDRGSKLEIEYRIDEDLSLVKEAELAALEARNEKLEQVMLEAAKLWAVWTTNRQLTPTLIGYLDRFGDFLSPLYTVKKD